MKYRCFTMPWGEGVDTVSDGRSNTYIGIDYEDLPGKNYVSPSVVGYLLWEQTGKWNYYEI